MLLQLASVGELIRPLGVSCCVGMPASKTIRGMKLHPFLSKPRTWYLIRHTIGSDIRIAGTCNTRTSGHLKIWLYIIVSNSDSFVLSMDVNFLLQDDYLFSWIREWLGVYCQCCVVLTLRIVTHAFKVFFDLLYYWQEKKTAWDSLSPSCAKRFFSSLNLFTIIITLLKWCTAQIYLPWRTR